MGLHCNYLDIIIVAEGITSGILKVLAINRAGLQDMPVIKGLSRLHLVRLLRLPVTFRKLFKFLIDIGRCIQILFWEPGLIFMVLDVRSIFSVESLWPLVRELARSERKQTKGNNTNKKGKKFYLRMVSNLFGSHLGC